MWFKVGSPSGYFDAEWGSWDPFVLPVDIRVEVEKPWEAEDELIFA